ncbi:MAG TPA: hypothetical protein VJ652_15220 [Noviherbaspirillum sp.]|nr:hypothetical protein [Noviherbaspirillum sp.]
MSNYTPKNPPLNLGRYGCPRCKVDLKRIKAQGCMSLHHECRGECNKSGWGSICKRKLEEA